MWFKLLLSITVLTAILGSVSAKNGKKVVCYYGSWAVYRPLNGKFDIENIDPFLCTHLIYTFVGIGVDGSIKILDSWNDIDRRGFARFNELKKKNPNLKTLIAIGGWNEGSEKYSKVAASKVLRTKFIDNAIKFVKTHGFDGFDLDWEYPAQRGGKPHDKVNFGLLVKEFRAAFDKHGLLITAAVGASRNAIGLSYDVPVISKYLHFINVMTYDLHGSWDRRTGQNAPLFASPIDTTPTSKELNVDACIKAWIDNGASPEKLVLGIGTYGRTFTLDSESKNGLGVPASQPGQSGPYTRQAGMLGYNEICEKQLNHNQKWTVVWDNRQKVPYAYLGRQWVGYDNPRSVAEKVSYAKNKKLGGLMIWSIETDDFRGICGKKYPILNAIKNAL